MVDPMGVVVAQCGIDEQLLMVDLDPCKVEASRRVLPVLENNRFAPPELQKLRSSEVNKPVRSAGAGSLENKAA